MRHLPLVLVVALSAGILLWNFSFYEVRAAAKHDSETLAGLDPGLAPELSDLGFASVADLERTRARLVVEGRTGSTRAEAGTTRAAASETEHVVDLGGGRPGERLRAPVPGQDLRPQDDGGLLNANGRRHGRWTRWWGNGRTRTEGEFEDGRRTRHWVQWFENGQVRADGTYELGLRDGRWVEWHVDGTPKHETHFQDGEPDGAWVEWYSNGRIKEHGRFERGLREGFWEFYDFEGRGDRRTGFYENGRRRE